MSLRFGVVLAPHHLPGESPTFASPEERARNWDLFAKIMDNERAAAALAGDGLGRTPLAPHVAGEANE